MYSDKEIFFSQMYEANYSNIRKWAYRHTGNLTTAEDITQETFLILVIKIDDAMAHPSPRAWLYTVARNLIGHEIRDMRKQMLLFPEIKAETEDDSLDLGLVEIFPNTFSDDDIRIMLMYYVERRSIKEVASSFGISASACKMRLLRLRNEIKKNL